MHYVAPPPTTSSCQQHALDSGHRREAMPRGADGSDAAYGVVGCRYSQQRLLVGPGGDGDESCIVEDVCRGAETICCL